MLFADDGLSEPKRIDSIAMMIQTKRVYEPHAATDGIRFLVERLWPRGVAKAAFEMNA